MGFKEQKQASRQAVKNVFSGGGGTFTTLVQVMGYRPANSDVKNWPTGGSPEDVMIGRFLNPVEGVETKDEAGQLRDIEIVFVGPKGDGKKGDARQHNIYEMAKGANGKEAMLVKNAPIMRIDGSYNKETGRIEARWMNRIHPKFDQKGAAVYAGQYISVTDEKEYQHESGEKRTRQPRNVAFTEYASPLSSFEESAEVLAIEAAGRYYGAPTGNAAQDAPFESAKNDFLSIIEDFRSGNRDRVDSAVRRSIKIAFESIERREGEEEFHPGLPFVVFRGVDSEADSSGIRIYRAMENYQPKSVEDSIKAFMADEELRVSYNSLIDYAVENPDCYWDVFPAVTIRTGKSNLPTQRVSGSDNDRKKTPEEVSDTRFYKTFAVGQDEKTGEPYNYAADGFRRSVMGIGKARVTDEDGNKQFKENASWYAMEARPINYGPPITIDRLVTTMMPETLVKQIHKVSADLHKEYRAFIKPPAEEKNAEPDQPQLDSVPDDTDSENENVPETGAKAYTM